jgi:hypothetical protein
VPFSTVSRRCFTFLATVECWAESAGVSNRRNMPSVGRGVAWGAVAFLAGASLLLFPLAVVVVPACAVVGLVLNHYRSSRSEFAGAWLGLAALCSAYAVGNAFRDDCPASGVRQVGVETRSCFDSVLFRTEPWAVAALVLFAVAAWQAMSVGERSGAPVEPSRS